MLDEPRILDYGDRNPPHSCSKVIHKLENQTANGRKLRLAARVICSCGHQYELRKESFWHVLLSFHYHPITSNDVYPHEWVRCG